MIRHLKHISTLKSFIVAGTTTGGVIASFMLMSVGGVFWFCFGMLVMGWFWLIYTKGRHL